MQIKNIMDDKVKELEERLRNRVRYNVGMDTAAPKKNNDYCEKDYCEGMGKCVCDSVDPDRYIKVIKVPMNYEDFMQAVGELFALPFEGSYIRTGNKGKNVYTTLLEALSNAKELEKYINKKDEFCKAASNKFKEIEKKFNENKLTKKDFSTDKFKPMSWEEREKKEKELIERLKENMPNVKNLMDRVGDRKQAEYIPAGKVENIEKETVIDSNVIKGAKTYMANPKPNCIPTENKTDSAKIFDEILETMRKTYYAKNTDYGSSFDKGIDRYGWTSFKTRIFDKFNRVETILDKKESDPDYKPLVQDEKLEDTLLDMANYAILAIIYLRTH